MTKNKKKIVYDTQGNEYLLTGKIGEGGQGMVCCTDRSSVLVKIINTKDPEKIASSVKQIQWVLQQNLNDLNLALPKIAITRPKHGYVMELMDGLISLEDVLQKSFNCLLDEGSADGYLKTGGVARRVQLLLAMATTLSELHSRGYAYGDLSPANIFVSENVAYSEVWFIDCDNICFNEREGVTHLHTPGYGAPEVVRGEQNVNCLTDAWAFAVLAFELLTHQHPFKGLYVEDGEPEIVEKQAYEGALPWVYDANDNSNESCGGLKLQDIANTKMIELFRCCFEDGRSHPLQRPSLNQWRSVLQEAVDQLLDCQYCRHQFFYDPTVKSQTCTFCDEVAEKESYLLFEQVLVLGEGNSTEYHSQNYTRILNKESRIQFKAAPYGTELWAESSSTLTVDWKDKRVHLSPSSKGSMLISKGARNETFHKNIRIPLNKFMPEDPYFITAWIIDEIEDDEHLKLVQSYCWRLV